MKYRAMFFCMFWFTCLSFLCDFVYAKVDVTTSIDDGLDSVFLNSSDIKLGDKPVMIVFGKDGCYHCSILSASLINNETIRGYIALNFLPYYINIGDNKKHTIPYLSISGLSSIDTARLYNIESLPFIVFIDTDGKEIMRVAGFPGEKRLVHLLGFIYNDIWKNYNTQKARVDGFLEYDKDLAKQVIRQSK